MDKEKLRREELAKIIWDNCPDNPCCSACFLTAATAILELEDSDDLTAAYMAGFEKGKDSREKEIAELKEKMPIYICDAHSKPCCHECTKEMGELKEINKNANAIIGANCDELQGIIKKQDREIAELKAHPPLMIETDNEKRYREALQYALQEIGKPTISYAERTELIELQNIRMVVTGILSKALSQTEPISNIGLRTPTVEQTEKHKIEYCCHCGQYHNCPGSCLQNINRTKQTDWLKNAKNPKGSTSNLSKQTGEYHGDRICKECGIEIPYGIENHKCNMVSDTGTQKEG